MKAVTLSGALFAAFLSIALGASADPAPALQSDPEHPSSGLYRRDFDGSLVRLESETWTVTEEGTHPGEGCLLFESSFTSDSMWPPGFWYEVHQCSPACEFEGPEWWTSSFQYGQCTRARFFKDGPESRVMYRSAGRTYDIQPFAFANVDGTLRQVLLFDWYDAKGPLPDHLAETAFSVPCEVDSKGQTVSHLSVHVFVDCVWSAENVRVLDLAPSSPTRDGQPTTITGFRMTLRLFQDGPTGEHPQEAAKFDCRGCLD